MQRTRSKLEMLTTQTIEAITRKSKRRKCVPLIVSRSTPIILNEELNAKIEVLSSAQGVKPNIFVNQLLKEDIDRLWKKFSRTG